MDLRLGDDGARAEAYLILVRSFCTLLSSMLRFSTTPSNGVGISLIVLMYVALESVILSLVMTREDFFMD